MKIKIILSLILIGPFMLMGCLGDLDVVQKSQLSANSMWKTESDATAAMYGMYNKFRSTFSYGLVYWGEYRNSYWGEGYTSTTELDNTHLNRISSTHSYSNWANLYTTINDCNLILRKVPEVSYASESNKNKVLANAYFVRAYCYYWIGRIWGDAPLLLEGFESDTQEGMFPTRDPADKIFAQVESDLNEASKVMPDVTDRYLASQGAINMLKTDYYLWMSKVRNGGTVAIDNARKALDVVLANKMYKLNPSFADVFASKQNDEIIFAWCNIKDEFTNSYPYDYLSVISYVTDKTIIENPVKIGSHQQWCFPNKEYKDLLTSDPGDTRAIVNFDTYTEPTGMVHQWVNKFSGSWESGTRIFDSDIIAYRYAEALLFDAEIKNAQDKTPDAIVALNKVAQRAYGVEDYYPSTLTKDEVNSKLMDERMKEFMAEGRTFWDMIRLGVVFQRVKTLQGREAEQNVLLWPVNQSTINKNPAITPTPGLN